MALDRSGASPASTPTQQVSWPRLAPPDRPVSELREQIQLLRWKGCRWRLPRTGWGQSPTFWSDAALFCALSGGGRTAISALSFVWVDSPTNFLDPEVYGACALGVPSQRGGSIDWRLLMVTWGKERRLWVGKSVSFEWVKPNKCEAVYFLYSVFISLLFSLLALSQEIVFISCYPVHSKAELY